MTDQDVRQQPKLPPLDQKLVRAVARSMWRVKMWEDKIPGPERKTNWETTGPTFLSQARKLIRQFGKDKVFIKLEDEAS